MIEATDTTMIEATDTTMIKATDTIHAVLARDERLLEVLASASPAFEKLRNAAMRRTMARLVSVEQAARIGGVDPCVLLARLNYALEHPEEPLSQSLPEPPAQPAADPDAIPEALRRIPPERVVECDVRDDLRAGIEPFRRIMDAARATPDGGLLKVRAIFEPAPLYPVLARQGFSHAVERLDDEDWCVWFYRDGASGASTPSPADATADNAPADDDVVVLDVRGLEPPEPMERTLEALAILPHGKTLVQINVRVPRFLLPKLEERGFTCEVRQQSDDLVRVFIRHQQP